MPSQVHEQEQRRFRNGNWHERARALAGNEFDLQIWVNSPHFLAESLLVSRLVLARRCTKQRPSLRALRPAGRPMDPAETRGREKPHHRMNFNFAPPRRRPRDVLGTT